MLSRKTQQLSDESMKIYNIMIPERSDLREIKKIIDFNFIYNEVSQFYDPYLGRPSEDPVRLVKAEFLKIKYNLIGDEELLSEISDRASFREFLDINIEEELWDRTTLVKFRQKVGPYIIEKLLDKVIEICTDYNMVGGIHEVIDGTNSKARARIIGNRDNIYVEETNVDSKEPVNVDTNYYQINVNQQDSFINLERTSYPKDDTLREEKRKREMIPVGERVSEGDPDARFYKRKNGEKSKLGYQNAYATDIKEGIITRTFTIPGNENMSDQIEVLIKNKVVPELTLDGEFSIGELISMAQDKGIIFNVPLKNIGARGVYPKVLFKYDYDLDIYKCPEGNILRPPSTKSDDKVIYTCSAKICKKCTSKDKCTKSKTKGRTIERGKYELAWEVHKEYIGSDSYQRAKVIRGILAEGKFFEANILYSLNRAKHVGIKLMHAQAQMTAIVINLKRFLKVMIKRNKRNKAENDTNENLPYFATN